ncbi:SpoIIE family protein phosphatase [Microcoleus sp. OTE_8_concoct_300]|uniref:SpoIIE family protein phosphatase n=1 Tax=Microcoleus sp. OTE_8_concoct_300 TaxID=2964710 RepID=UPI00403FB7CD
MKNSSLKFRLHTALVVPFILQIVAAVGLVGYLSLRNGQHAVTELANQLMTEVSNQTDQQLNDYLSIPHRINQINIDAIETGLLNIENFDLTGSYFWKQVQAFNNVGYISNTLADGRFIGAGKYFPGEGVIIDELSARTNVKVATYAVNKQGERGKVLRFWTDDFVASSWYIEAAKAGKSTWSSVYSVDEINFISLAAVRPIYAKNGKLLGVTGVDLQLSNITNFLRHLNVSSSGRVFVMERDGQLIANSSSQPSFAKVNGKTQRFNALNINDPLIQRTAQTLKNRFSNFQRITKRQTLNFQIQGQPHFVRVHPWHDQFGLNWLIVTVVPESDFMGQINANTRTTIGLSLVALMMAVLIGILTAGWITRPIERITQASEDMADGNLKQYVKHTRLVELDKLGNSFNRMADQLKELFETLEDKVKQRTAELATANHEIITLNERLKEDNLRMGAELDIVRQMQQMILPNPEELEIEGLDIAGYMEAADEVGGDYYDVLNTDGVVTLGIGDVTGHGLESGILMLMAQTAVRTLKEIRETDPVRFLDALNRTLYKNVQRMNSEKSLTLAILNYSEGWVSISGQHEETLIVRNGGQVERMDTMDLGLPIALHDDIAEFISHISIELQLGDGIVLYTDGIPEAKDINKKQYGVEQMCEVISQNWHLSAQEIKQAVIDDLRGHIGTQKVFDDITLLVVKRTQLGVEKNSQPQAATLV